MRLYLVGYMGCGKSTLGRKLARALQCDFVDTDSMVEQAQGATIADIITYEGEERFREYEREALEQTAQYDNAIISTGGGLPIWGDNMERIHALGPSIYIRRSAEQIASRLSPHGRQKRPKLRGLSDEELVEFMSRNMAEREPVYVKADMVLDAANRSDWELIEEIANFLTTQL